MESYENTQKSKTTPPGQKRRKIRVEILGEKLARP